MGQPVGGVGDRMVQIAVLGAAIAAREAAGGVAGAHEPLLGGAGPVPGHGGEIYGVEHRLDHRAHALVVRPVAVRGSPRRRRSPRWTGTASAWAQARRPRRCPLTRRAQHRRQDYRVQHRRRDLCRRDRRRRTQHRRGRRRRGRRRGRDRHRRDRCRPAQHRCRDRGRGRCRRGRW